jgi:hypothetical protein
MSKPHRTDFKAILNGIAPPVAEELAPEPTAVVTAPVASAPAPETVAWKQRRALTPEPVGQGTLKQRARQMSLYLEAPVYEQLREIAHHERTKIHPLILEAIDLLLKKRGSPSIKQLMQKTGSAVL